MTSSKLWGGRFSSGPHEAMEAINASIDVDRRLAEEDLAGSRAHCAMLIATGIIAREDGEAILKGLDQIAAEIGEGRFPFRREHEDIHLNIEARLTELIGPAAGRLHTARSRNDQVATDLKLFTRDACDDFDRKLKSLIGALLGQAETHADTIMPGFTHLQTAQPITVGHYMLAYVEMFARDRARFADARQRLNECPLGAAALAGTSFPIDRAMTAKALGFARPQRNALDAVSDRDFALEALSAAAISAMHLSRLAEEIVIFASAEFGFVKLPDEWTTGSSIMPQKRNPDAAELVRAKTGRINGALMGLLTVMKGLPLAYAKDMQEDKALTFDALDSLSLALQAMTGMIQALTLDKTRLREAAARGYSTATDLADWLVQNLKLPFRQAHHAAGQLVALAEKRGVPLEGLALSDMRRIEPRITDAIFGVLSLERSVASRKSEGGTAPENVRRQAAEWRKRLASEERKP
jgi:argininosuccinate lyase